MSCLERFLWTKLPRSVVPSCKGILSHWAHLAARAAFRKGIASIVGTGILLNRGPGLAASSV